MKIKEKKPNPQVKDGPGPCGICHLTVRFVDDYVTIQDYIKGLKHSEGVYHRTCFRERMGATPEMKKLQAMAGNIMSRVDKTLGGMGI